jgi:hypothetical protein
MFLHNGQYFLVRIIRSISAVFLPILHLLIIPVFTKQSEFEFFILCYSVECMKLTASLLLTLAILTSFTACVNTSPYSEFVKTVKFSSLDTFSFKQTLITGMDFRESEELLLEELSKQIIVEELQLRGFEPDPAAADFFAVVKWKKSVSIYANPYDHIDPYSKVIDRRDDPTSRFASRLHLTLEIYENSTRNLFWRNELPNIFDALQLSEKRVANLLKVWHVRCI